MFLCVMMLSGCSWLQIDNARYYGQVVATVGNQKFYKKDLIEAFSSYGYQYYQSYGYTLEEAVNETIKSMIDRWLLLDKVKTMYEIDDPEKLDIKAQAFEYMQNSIFSIEAQVREEWDMTVPAGSATDETKTPLRAEEQEYTPSTYYTDRVVERTEQIEGKDAVIYYRAVVTRTEDFSVVEDRVETVVDATTQKTKTIKYYKVVEEIEDTTNTNIDSTITLTSHFDKSRQVITDKKVSDEAWVRYVKSLQDAAKSQGKSTDEAEVLLEEEKRLEELLTNNLYLEKYQNEFNANFPVDTDTVLTYFRTQYKEQRDKYLGDESLYHTAMKNASKTYTYFHPNSGNEYVNVKHILVKFSDAQTEAMNALNKEFDIKNDGTDADNARKDNAIYKAKRQKIVNQTTSTFEMDGETKTWNVLDVYDYVVSQVSGTPKERAAKFNELMYIFNDDEGSMNSEFDYVVNLDTAVQDQMVKEFADGVRALDKSNGGEGAGSMSYIVSEYGIHILFHAGNATNLVEEKNIDNISDEDLLRILCTTYTTPESNKSIFNYIYDTLSLDTSAYDVKSQNDINTIKTQLRQDNVVIELYVDNYKDLWED